MRTFTIIIVVLSIATVTPALPFCFEEAGQFYGVSPYVLWAIAKQESNFCPNAINYNKNGTYDYGVMQINSIWYDKLGHERWMMLSAPCYNVMIGAWILSKCIQKHGYTWEAIGCYNASSKVKRNKYAWKIYNTLKKNKKTSSIPTDKVSIVFASESFR